LQRGGERITKYVFIGQSGHRRGNIGAILPRCNLPIQCRKPMS
jgi:hypothetical protein